MAFPVSPTNGSTAVVNSIVYQYDSADNAWTRLSSPPGNLTVTSNLTSSGNLITSNLYVSTLRWANGVSISLTGTYSNVNVEAYIGANIGSLLVNAATQATSINTINANLGAYQLYANANIGTLFLGNASTQANIGRLFLGNASTNANLGAFQAYANTKIGTNPNSNLVVVSTATSANITSGALVVAGGIGVAGNVISGGNITGSFGTFISNLSIGPNLIQQDALNLNNNNLYNVNTIRINDPGTSEGIAWEGGSGWNIYESPNDLSNNTGNLQIVLSGTRVFTVDTNQTVNIPSTRAATSTTTGALTVGGGAGIAGALHIANTGDVSANIGAYQTYANVYLSAVTTFAVTNAGAGAYVIDSESNPALYLVRGQRYNFALNASGHPFWIKTAPTTGTGDQYNTGVTNNGNAVGLITFEVPLTAPDVLYYICQFHSSMVGQLRIVNFANIDANVGTLFLGDVSTNANLGAFQLYANTKIGNNSNGNLVVVAATTSTDTTTGALVVGGGAGIAGNAYVGGNVVVTSNVLADKFFTTQGLYWSGNGVAFSSGGGGGSGNIDYVASASAPVSPDDGDFWYNTTTGILFQYLTDGVSSYWFDIQTQAITGNVPAISSTYTNSNVEAYIGANIGSYQLYANANAATQATSINAINAAINNILSPFLLGGM